MKKRTMKQRLYLFLSNPFLSKLFLLDFLFKKTLRNMLEKETDDNFLLYIALTRFDRDAVNMIKSIEIHKENAEKNKDYFLRMQSLGMIKDQKILYEYVKKHEKDKKWKEVPETLSTVIYYQFHDIRYLIMLLNDLTDEDYINSVERKIKKLKSG